MELNINPYVLEVYTAFRSRLEYLKNVQIDKFNKELEECCRMLRGAIEMSNEQAKVFLLQNKMPRERLCRITYTFPERERVVGAIQIIFR